MSPAVTGDSQILRLQARDNCGRDGNSKSLLFVGQRSTAGKGCFVVETYHLQGFNV